ncbi:MAG: ATP-binding protein [Burkholderiaceae bacterium]|nr:ATP-binding protein [Burkholderiaceae bacterium]
MSGFAQLMLDHSSQMLLLVEPTAGRIVGANRAAQDALGYPQEKLLAMTIDEIESTLKDVFYWGDVRAGRFQEIVAQEDEYRCADGSMLAVSKSISVVSHEGRQLLFIQASNAGERRQNDNILAQTLSQLQATLESTGNGILVIDWESRITNMNRLLSMMWEIPDALMLDQNDAEILAFIANNVVETDACRARLREVVDRHEALDVLHLKDGRIFECSSRPQYLGEQIVGRVFGYSDITARTMAEQAIRESRDMLEERVYERTADLRKANETLEVEKKRQEVLIKRLEDAHNQLLQAEKMASLGQLAAGVAHEINNPVGFVNSNLGTLQQYSDDMLRLLAAYERWEKTLAKDAQQEMARLKAEIDVDFLREDIGNLLSESLDGMQRVRRIVQDLKDFSHVDEVGRQWANLESGLDSTLRVIWNELKYKAEIIKEYGAISDIECLPSQLNQVFMNLLVNAAQSIENSGRITIRTGEEGEGVWVEIEDTGHGIKPEHLSRIFDPFFTTKPIGKGTGLGLSLSYGIVQKHDGRIEVKSDVGKGTVFKVLLPKRSASGSGKN